MLNNLQHPKFANTYRPLWMLLCTCFFLTSCTVSEPSIDGPKISFGWGRTIHGYGYWDIYSNDTVVYRGAYTGAKTDMDGWTWTNQSKKTGFAILHIPRSYEQALDISENARKDPILRHEPQREICLDYGNDAYWLDPNTTTPTLSVGCLPDHPKSRKDQQFAKRVAQLNKALHGVVLNTARRSKDNFQPP